MNIFCDDDIIFYYLFAIIVLKLKSVNTCINVIIY